MHDPIFIVGCGRTGSKIYLQVLNLHPEVGLGYEMHLINPWYRLLKNDALTQIKNIGPLKNEENLRKAIDLCFSDRLEGNFWDYLKRNVDKKTVYRKMKTSDMEIKDLLSILLEETAKKKAGNIPGSKFPLHFGYVRKLKDWFPDCKVVHTIRDPRAILASELKREVKPNYPLSKDKRFFYDVGIILYVITQWTWASRCHKRYQEIYSKSYKLIRFEDVVSSPEKQIKELCDFLEIDYDKDILNINTRGSSYEHEKKSGFDEEAIKRWEKALSDGKRRLVELLLGHKMRELGYMPR